MITKEEMKTLMNVGTDAEDDEEVDRIIRRHGIGHVLDYLEEERMANELTALVQVQDRQIMKAIKAIPPTFPHLDIMRLVAQRKAYIDIINSQAKKHPEHFTIFLSPHRRSGKTQEAKRLLEEELRNKYYYFGFDPRQDYFPKEGSGGDQRDIKPILITQAPSLKITKRQRRLNRFFNGEGKYLECKCGYDWVYLGKRKKWATCPQCFKQVKL